MGLGGVEVDAVTFFEHDGLTSDIQLHRPFENEVELLSGMGVLIDGASSGLGLYCDDEHVCLVVNKTTHQTLILIGLGTLYRHTLSLAHYEVRLHVGRLGKDEFLR